MSTSPMPVAAQVGGLKTQLRERYRALAPRERLLVAAAAAVLLFYAVWSVAVQPALRSRRARHQVQPSLRYTFDSSHAGPTSR